MLKITKKRPPTLIFMEIRTRNINFFLVGLIVNVVGQNKVCGHR